MPGPIFEHIGDAQPNFTNNAVALSFLDAGNKRFDCEISLSCMSATLAAMVAALGQLIAKLPAGEYPPQQGLVAKGWRAAMSDKGDPALKVLLENGAELNFQFRPEGLAKLSEVFSELMAMADRKMHH